MKAPLRQSGAPGSPAGGAELLWRGARGRGFGSGPGEQPSQCPEGAVGRKLQLQCGKPDHHARQSRPDDLPIAPQQA